MTSYALAIMNLRLGNCASLIVLTSVGYDYVLLFSDEVEYIWSKRWTFVSALFILVRYVGLFNLVISCLLGSGFIPAIEKSQCDTMSIMKGWSFIPFLGAADFVMVLRIWAMYNQSKLILCILLVSFSLEIIPDAVFSAIFSKPSNLREPTIQVLNLSVCNWQWMSPMLTIVVAILQMAHGAILCSFAVAQFVRQSLQMYNMTKRWQINRYMNLLVRQGILYFIARVFLISIVNVLSATGKYPKGGWHMVLFFVLQVPMYSLAPRFILSIRKVYARDVRGRYGSGIDTGFGLTTACLVAGTAIEFADVEGSWGTEHVGEIPMEGVDALPQ